MIIVMPIVMARNVDDGDRIPNRIRNKMPGNKVVPNIVSDTQIAVYKRDCLKMVYCSGVMRPLVVTLGNMAITIVLDKNTVNLPSVAA